MGAVKKNQPNHVLALIKRHTRTTPPPPKVIPPTSLWDKIRGRRNG